MSLIARVLSARSCTIARTRTLLAAVRASSLNLRSRTAGLTAAPLPLPLPLVPVLVLGVPLESLEAVSAAAVLLGPAQEPSSCICRCTQARWDERQEQGKGGPES